MSFALGVGEYVVVDVYVMFEDFKEQVQQKQKRATAHTVKCSYEAEKIEQHNADRATLADALVEGLDSEGYDLSLVSGAEWDFMFLYSQIRKYFLERYPQTREEAHRLGVVWCEADNAPVQFNGVLAKMDPKSGLFFETMCKVMAIYDKIRVLQNQASAYEKFCLRFYWHIAHNEHGVFSPVTIRNCLSDCELFEIVETYFKICRKYNVPIFEKPYYFLSDKRRCEVKLAGDVLRRTTGYDDFEIRISILEALA